jgi:hypothetical protein
MSNSRLNQTEKVLQDQLRAPELDPKSRSKAIAGLAAIAVAKLKLKTLRERRLAREKAQKQERKNYGLMD